jgi:hypothetical protein
MKLSTSLSKIKKIVGWIVIDEKQLVKLKLGRKEEPKEILFNAMLPSVFQPQIKKVLMEYKCFCMEL